MTETWSIHVNGSQLGKYKSLGAANVRARQLRREGINNILIVHDRIEEQ